jgi:glycosyltransferase involved in cell wall biosynthesis
MKILFLNYEYPPLGGGAANATQYILREFSRMPDVEVHLVTSGVGADYEKSHVGGNVWVHRLPIGKDGKNIHSQSQKDLLTYAYHAWKFGSKLIKEARRSGVSFERTIAFFGVPCGVVALWFKWRFGIPYVVSLRGSDVPGYSEKYGGLMYALLKVPILMTWKCALAVVPNSQGLMELARKSDPKRAFTIIPNGVDTEEFKPDPAREHDGIFRVLVVGRLTPRKGLRFLIRSMGILNKRSLIRQPADRDDNDGRLINKIELWLVGDGEERPVLEALAKECGVADQVKFFGAVPHGELPKYYGLADVFCLPSLNEGMSNTVLEAIAAGLPIVATVTGGTDELVTDGENGFFVKQESPEDLAEKLSVLLSDESLRRRMGEASRKRAVSMSWRVVAEKFLETLSADKR